MRTPHSDSLVEEIQGLYGPFTFTELLFQKIWAEGSFDRAQLVTTDGQQVTIRNTGRWNKLAGPDFMQARIRIGDEPEWVGDVELHLRAEDWSAHGHAKDPAYAEVKLHVVLFPPKAGAVTRNGNGRAIPTLVLLPWLHHDLEEYAAEDAVEVLANHPEKWALAKLGELPQEDLRELLDVCAERRWKQKVHFAGVRIAKEGWNEACHQTAMEILGFRYNRVPMLQVAMVHPLAAWRDPDFTVDDLIGEGEWRASGVRPANHPKRRLRQYAEWTQARPAWPGLLCALADQLPKPEFGGKTTSMRREHGLTAWRVKLHDEICGEALSGTRFDTMICDGFWPLLASRTGNDFSGLWYHWYSGDAPAALLKVLRQMGRFNAPESPACHGAVQGLLGHLLTGASQSGD